MTLRPRFALGSILLTSVLLAAVAWSAPAIRLHPVGWERIPRPPLPAPVAAAEGGVYVPTALRQFPTIEFDTHVADDDAQEMFGVSHTSAPVGIAGADHTQIVGSNVRANNTAGDPAGSTQSETSIAALGSNLVAGWNDGKNFATSPGGSGYASSNNGGLTWTDGGVLPVPSITAVHEGDPVLTNDNAGNFYYSDLYTPDGLTSAIAICHGSFSGGVIVWNMPVMIASSPTDFLDKEWIAADKVSGTVYCTWTHFLAGGGNFIEFSKSIDNGATWSAPVALTSNAVESVQGSRVAVGPSGEVQVVYFVYDIASGNNYIRARRSTDGGGTWGAEVTLPTGPSGIISGYGSGPAGFNRAGGIGFPSLAIDRTAGSNSGRVYATWEETVNFYFDPLGSLGPVAEVESNGSFAAANPITIGQSVTGTLSSTADQDWFSFSGTAGQTVIIYLVPTGGADGFLRLFAGGGGTPNRTQLSYIGTGTGLCVYTLPSTGTYAFRVLANSTTLGGYTVYTGLDVPDPGDEVGRDTRDVILQSSPDGVTWDTRRVINDDAPKFDNAFPEVAIDKYGQVFVDWYDHRSDPFGILTDIRYNVSSNGGLTFAPSIQVNDAASINWNNVASNLAPNMGDYSNLVADNALVYANFADGRQGSPDSWVAVISDLATATTVALVHANVAPDHVDLAWYSADLGGRPATVFRRERATDWTPIATIDANGSGMLEYRDTQVSAGASYAYRVGFAEGAGTSYSGETWVDVPSSELAIRHIANPVVGDLSLSVVLPGPGPARLQLIDVTGRAVATVNVTASGSVRVARNGLASGVYWLRLSQGARVANARAVLVD